MALSKNKGEKRMKRRCVLCFVVVMIAMCFLPVFAKGSQESVTNGSQVGFNKEGLPIVDDTYTLTFTGMNMNTTRIGRYDETDMMKKLESDTNVKIVWNMIPQASWKEKKNLMIASGEYPDGFMGPMSLTADEAQQLGAEGILIPLEDLIKEYASNIQKIIDTNPTYKAQITSPDGHIYAISAWQDMGFDSLMCNN